VKLLTISDYTCITKILISVDTYLMVSALTLALGAHLMSIQSSYKQYLGDTNENDNG
jgi:hypothetical protein